MAYTTKLVSITKTGLAGNGPSGINGSVSSFNDGTVNQTAEMAAISQSSDGRFVVFTSAATNFYSDTNGYNDIFLKDMVTGTLTAVAQSNGTSASFPEVSDDGKYVTFLHGSDIYRRDMTTGALDVVSKNVAGSQVAADAPEMTNDGRYIVFNTTNTDVTGHQQVYLRDMQLGTSQLISVDSDGTTIGNGDSSNAYVSEDGKYVVFQSKSSNYAAGNANAYEEIFLKNIATGELTRISETASHGGGVTGASINATFSGNGRYVVFESAANDLDSITTMAGNSTIISVIYRKDLVTGAVELVSEGLTGKASAWDADPSISADGRFILFKSHLGGVGDNALNNGVTPLSPDYYSYYYIKDMATGKVFNIDLPRGSLTMKISVLGHTVTSPTSYAGLPPYQSYNATLSADGTHVTLSSTQALNTGKITAYTSLNGIITPDDDLKGNNDNQFDVFSIDVSKIASSKVTAQTITGSSGSDTFVGGISADTLKGLGGDDIYKVELILSGKGASALAKIKHIVKEIAGEGSDTISLFGAITGLTKATVLKLIPNIENLDVSGTGSTWLNLLGNAVDNSIIGNAANNILNGSTGNDTLFGGEGSDIFLFDTKLTTKLVNTVITFTNFDTINDFLSGTDAINLSKKIFTKAVIDSADLDATNGRNVSANDLVQGITLQDAQAARVGDSINAHFLYDSTAHALYFDADGSGTKAQPIEFAVLTGINTLLATDLHIV